MIGTTRNEDEVMEKGLLPAAVTATTGGPRSCCCEKISSAQVTPQPSHHDWKEQKCHIWVRYCGGSPLLIRLPRLEAPGRCILWERNQCPRLCSSWTSGNKAPSSLVSTGEKSKAVGWKIPHNLFFFFPAYKTLHTIHKDRKLHACLLIRELGIRTIRNSMHCMQVGQLKLRMKTEKVFTDSDF